MTGAAGDPRAWTDDVRQWLADNGQPATPTAIATALRSRGEVLGTTQVLSAMSSLRAEFFGAGPLQDLISERGVTDVLVNGPHQVWVDRGEGLAEVDSPFRNDDEVRRLAQRLASLVGRRLDESCPFVDARLGDGTRVHAVLACVAEPGTLISLRVPGRREWALRDLVRLEAIPNGAEAWLLALMRSRASFLVSGGTGSGKTTVLAALLGHVPDSERLVVIEDSAELRLDHWHTCYLEARPGNTEGRGTITLSDLLRQALRMRPDRIIVGEVRGAEVADLMSALNTGHEGGCGTVHANSAADVPARLEALAATAGLPRPALHAQLAAGLEAVVHLARRNGRRVISGIAEVDRSADSLCRVREVVAFRASGPVVRQPRSALVARLLAGLP